MLPELSPSLEIRQIHSSDLNDLIVYTVQKDGRDIAGLVRCPKQWILSFEQGDPLTFSKARQVVRFLNQLA